MDHPAGRLENTILVSQKARNKIASVLPRTCQPLSGREKQKRLARDVKCKASSKSIHVATRTGRSGGVTGEGTSAIATRPQINERKENLWEQCKNTKACTGWLRVVENRFHCCFTIYKLSTLYIYVVILNLSDVINHFLYTLHHMRNFLYVFSVGAAGQGSSPRPAAAAAESTLPEHCAAMHFWIHPVANSKQPLTHAESKNQPCAGCSGLASAAM